MGSCHLCAWLTLLHTTRASDWQSLYPSSRRVWEREQLLFFSYSVTSESVTNGLQHIRLFCPSPSQTHVHWVGDAIQPSHPLLSLSALAFNLSLHQGLSQWIGSSHQVAKVLEFQLQHQSFQWIFMTDFLWDWFGWYPCSPRDSQECSPTPQFKSINSLALSFLFSPTLTSIHDYWKIQSFD